MRCFFLNARQGAALHLLLQHVVDHVETSAFGIGTEMGLVVGRNVAKLALFGRQGGSHGLRVAGLFGGLELGCLVRSGF